MIDVRPVVTDADIDTYLDLRNRAAKAAGGGRAFLRTQNDVGNEAMPAVNEKLGYERQFEWAHLVGPLSEP